VYISEILQAIDEVAEVDHVLECTLFGNGQAPSGNVEIGPLSLATAGSHQIEVVS
jgi:hypothetical protein